LAAARNAIFLIAGAWFAGGLAFAQAPACKGHTTYQGGALYSDGGSVEVWLQRPCKEGITTLAVKRTLTDEIYPLTVDGQVLPNGSKEESAQLRELDAIVTRRAGAKSLSEFMKEQLATFLELSPEDNYMAASALIQSSCGSLKTLAKNPMLCLKYAVGSIP